ncbi:splicing factor 3a [Apiospora arundinis]|uniref:Matrin-type domain-containing protein n=1 Tax=Apiospora arundinis TaxID=335852 RepID=A0ABR2I3S4_9PEZI
MLLEEQRFLHEDLERLEQGIADRIGEEPKHIRDRLTRDHQVSEFLDRIASQSNKLLEIYRDADGTRSKEIQQIGTGDPMEEFHKQLAEIKSFHTRYPNEPVENLERAYRPRKPTEAEAAQPTVVDSLFTGEEAFGRFFDLHTCHEAYLNLHNAKRLSYLQYLDVFDNFSAGAGGLKRGEKLTDQYFRYAGILSQYLEGFMKRTRPLENVDKVLADFDREFDEAWEKDEVEGWKSETVAVSTSGVSRQLNSAEAVYCEDCEKEFKNENVYKGHLSGKKHVRAAADRKKRIEENQETADGSDNKGGVSATRLKERAIAEREHRVKRLASAMSTERSDTRVNVERKQGMTERERQQELENLFSATVETQPAETGEGEEGDDDDDRFYNPLKLPLAWDGKPIPYWLYKLHGLGVEFSCEVCGNFVYMGRRAFDKHFNEARHIYGLKCLGITNTSLFRDITGIDEALRLWEKIQKDKKKDKIDDGAMVQMEDADGNVMPEKVYYDLQKQGLL